MKTIHVQNYGDFLTSRENGRLVYEAIKRDYLTPPPNGTLFCAFEGVKVLAPSFADEVFGTWESEFPGTLLLDSHMGPALKTAFEVIQETRKIIFHFSDPPLQ